MKNKFWVAGFLVIATLSGCTSVPERGAARTVYTAESNLRVDMDANSDPDPSDLDSVKSLLYAQYDEWKGTRYRMQGMSKNGIDCSGFIHMTFKSKLGIVLPRSSDLQADLGIEVDRDQLQAGDLVFFKTGKTRRHVGVYLEDGRFLHATTKLGVVISRLNENYWRSAYWKAKRLEI